MILPYHWNLAGSKHDDAITFMLYTSNIQRPQFLFWCHCYSIILHLSGINKIPFGTDGKNETIHIHCLPKNDQRCFSSDCYFPHHFSSNCFIVNWIRITSVVISKSRSTNIILHEFKGVYRKAPSLPYSLKWVLILVVGWFASFRYYGDWGLVPIICYSWL